MVTNEKHIKARWRRELILVIALPVDLALLISRDLGRSGPRTELVGWENTVLSREVRMYFMPLAGHRKT